MKLKLIPAFSILTIIFFLAGCRSQGPAIQYNQLIKVPVGTNANYRTLEDEPVLISYEIQKLEESIDLSLIIDNQPSVGKLSGCEITKTKLTCLYTPKSDYFGQDSFSVRSQDGKIQSDKKALLTIDIDPVNDPPFNKIDLEIKDVIKNNTIDFQVELGLDPDTPAPNLSYTIVSLPTNGTVKDCFLSSGNRSCSYTPAVDYIGVDEFTYVVVDDEGESSNPITVRINVSEEIFSITESFLQSQKSLNGFDLVWVVDNSKSMDDEQDKLAVNTDSFIQKFVDSNIASSDFKMAVTTTEAWYSDGQTFRTDINNNIYDFSRASLASNRNNFVYEFQDAVRVGTNARIHPSTNIQLEKVLASMERAYLENPGWYGGDDKALLYIILTDEPEQSSERSVSEWISRFSSLKSNSNSLMMFPIYNLNQDNGSRFEMIGNHFGVSKYDVTQEFDNILDSISNHISSLLDSFQLQPSRNIIANSIKVYVNNVELSNSSSGNPEWTFTNNSIIFNNEPSAGAEIKVFYQYTL